MSHWAPPRPQPKPYSRRAVRVVVSAIVALVLVQVGLVGLVAVSFMGLALDVAPADFQHMFFVTVRNDTDATVKLTHCGPDCRSLGGWDTLPAGIEAPLAALDTDTAKWLVVSDATGLVHGCLSLRYTTKEPGVVIDVSPAQPCPAGTPYKVAPLDCGCGDRESLGSMPGSAALGGTPPSWSRPM